MYILQKIFKGVRSANFTCSLRIVAKCDTLTKSLEDVLTQIRDIFSNGAVEGYDTKSLLRNVLHHSVGGWVLPHDVNTLSEHVEA